MPPDKITYTVTYTGITGSTTVSHPVIGDSATFVGIDTASSDIGEYPLPGAVVRIVRGPDGQQIATWSTDPNPFVVKKAPPIGPPSKIFITGKKVSCSQG